MGRRRYLLAFDARRGTGVREHFFHYMWGYLLPAVHAILEIRFRERGEAEENEYVFVSCGPIMDVKTEEMARLLGVQHSFVQDERHASGPETTVVTVARWDLFLWQYAAYVGLPWRRAVVRLLREAIGDRSVLPVARSRRSIARAIVQVRDATLRVLPGPRSSSSDHDPSPYYLLLKRSAQPAYYAPGLGQAKNPTYGTGRRSLVGIEAAATALSQASRRVAVFEPGIHTLAEQIRTFHESRGVIGIRGAELANIVWLDAPSRVIVVNAGTFQLPAPPARGLAHLLGLRYAEIDWGDDPYPELTSDLVERIQGLLDT
jgi:hypothetical protein